MKSHKTSVTLEDLLRIKRAEQPPEKFWDEFNRELRAKQLAAIVEPRPWWAPFIRLGSRVSKYQLPVGAAAVLVVSFITIQDYHSPNIRPTTFASEVISAPMERSVAVESQPSEAVALSQESTSNVMAESTIGRDNLDPSSAQPVVESVAVHVPSRYEPGSVMSVPSEPTPSARYIAANLAALQASDPSLVDDAFGATLRRVVGRAPVRDPLTQASATGESRRARLLATALPVSASNADAFVATSDRVARSLTEERLYDSISRVGVKGDRVAIKF
jgi:hypothetical protein